MKYTLHRLTHGYKLLLALAILLAAIGCNKESQQVQVSPAKKEPVVYKIGVIAPMTGQVSFLGDFTKQGLELAQEEINASGGINGNKITLIYEDTKSNPKDATTAVNNLISIKKVPVIIGDITSSATLAVAPIVERSKVVLLANGGSDPKVRDAGDYVFRNWNSDDYEAKPMAEFAVKTMGYKRIAILYAHDEYCLGLKNAFEKYFIENGGTVVASLDYKPGNMDFRTIILKLPKDIDAVYLDGYPQELGHFVKQSKELKRLKPYLSSVGVQSDDFLKVAGNLADGIIFTAPYFEAEKAEGPAKDFVERFTKKYGKAPEIVAAVSYDALKIIADAIGRGGYSSDAIKKALYQTKDFAGVTGNTSFDDHGDVAKPVSIKVIQKGKYLDYASVAPRQEPRS